MAWVWGRENGSTGGRASQCASTDECGEQQECANVVRWVVSMGLAIVSDVLLMVVVDQGLKANESPWD